MASSGRKADHFRTSSGETIVGLIHQRDGRYRILATGKRFTADSEAEAIATFYRLAPKVPTVEIPVGQTTVDALMVAGSPDLASSLGSTAEADGTIKFFQNVPAPKMWQWFRDQLLKNASEVARMTGLPGLATIDLRNIPRDSIKLADLIAAYLAQNPGTEKSKRETAFAMKKLAKRTNAKTVADLTQEALTDFRIAMATKAVGTQQTYFTRIKSILGFGLKIGMDQGQLRAALDRCRVLWTSSPISPMQPHPMSKENFHKLLNDADPVWRARLLIAMNCCFYIADLRDLKWADLDLEKGTFVAIRGKTRIPRVASLWAETVEAIKTLPHRGQSPHVFTSSHGTNFNRNTMGNHFKALRKKAGLPFTVKFADIRDGSYTAAAQAATDPRWAQVLAGHSSGMQDHYIMRDVAKVKPACDAVYTAYGPFPMPAQHDPTPS